MGDSSVDPRKNFEDAYLYFAPSKMKLYKHYFYVVGHKVFSTDSGTPSCNLQFGYISIFESFAND